MKLTPAGAKQFRELGRFQFRYGEKLAVSEFVEIEKCERGSLRFRRAGNPNRKLLRLEFFNLCRPGLGEIAFIKIDIFRLQTLFVHFETTPACVAKKPETIARCFAIGGELRRFAQGRVKDFLSFGRISQHQKTKAIKLKEILFLFFGHADFFPAAMLRASRRSQAAIDLNRSDPDWPFGRSVDGRYLNVSAGARPLPRFRGC